MLLYNTLAIKHLIKIEEISLGLSIGRNLKFGFGFDLGLFWV